MNTPFDDLEDPADFGRIAPKAEAPKPNFAGHFFPTVAPRSYSSAPKSAKPAAHVRAAAAVATFETQNPAEFAWLRDTAARGTFEFAVSLWAQLRSKGDLSENQLAAVRRCLARDAARVEAKVAVQTAAVQVDVSRIEGLFATARKNALKKPTLRVGEVVLSLAGENSRNPGAVYVKRSADAAYLGKIVGGYFQSTPACTAADVETVEATARDPLGLAVAYGRRTGNCACCGRVLTDRESVERGIGPICESKWGL